MSERGGGVAKLLGRVVSLWWLGGLLFAFAQGGRHVAREFLRGVLPAYSLRARARERAISGSRSLFCSVLTPGTAYISEGNSRRTVLGGALRTLCPHLTRGCLSGPCLPFPTRDPACETRCAESDTRAASVQNLNGG